MDELKPLSPADGQNERVSGIPPLCLNLRPGGLKIELTETEVVIGRHSDVDLRLPLPDVSRRHCRLYFAADAWHLLDLGSLNGVYVNGKRVQHALLQPGDQIGIGGFTLEVAQTPRTPSRSEELLRPAEALQHIVQELTPASNFFPHRKAS